MKVFIIAALTADGFIGRDANHLADWSSHEDKVRFVRLTKEAGTVVFGNNTFKTFGKALPGRRNIVLTRDTADKQADNVEFTSESPEELIERLRSEGVESVAIGGGREIYTLFMKAGLVTDLYLTVEPLTFGSGVTLFSADVDVRLQLEAADRLGENSLALHYTVQNA